MSYSIEQQKCDHCKNEYTELYHCETCNRNGEEFPQGKELLCHICIAPHLVIDHAIIDNKGHKPLACEDHKLVERNYCRVCDVTFCWKCMSKHSEHKFEPLEKRGSELRGKIFDMLTELELKEKPSRSKKDEISETIMKHKRVQKQLREEVDSENEKLRKRCYKVIEDNTKILTDDLEDVTRIIDETVNLQKSLRDLLGSSNAHLLRQFMGTEQDVIRNRDQQDKVIQRKETDIESCQLEVVAKQFGEFGVSILGELKSEEKERTVVLKQKKSDIWSEAITKCFIVKSGGKLYKMSTCDGVLNIEKIEISENERVSIGTKQSIEFNETITIHHVMGNSCIFLLNENKKLHNLELGEKISLKCSFPVPSFNHILLPYVVSLLDLPTDTIYWCYWDEENELIRFSHNDTFVIKCDTLPRVTNSHQRNFYTLFFITDENNVIMADVHYSLYWVIPFNSTAHISCVSERQKEFFNRFVLIWCCEDESVFISEKKDEEEEFTTSVRYQWNTTSMFTQIRDSDRLFRLLPRLQMPSGETYNAFIICD